MSRISFTTVHKNQQVEVIAGWDNPLQTFFLDIMVDNEDDDLVYSSMYENNLEDIVSVDRLKNILAIKRIEVPKGFWEKVALKEGNVTCNFGNFSNFLN